MLIHKFIRKTSVVDIVEKTVDFLERTGTDKLAQQYLHFALTGFAAGCADQLAHYLVRYDIPASKISCQSAQLTIKQSGEVIACFLLDSYANLIGRVDPQTHTYPNVDLGSFDANAKVSRRHAKIYSLDGNNFWIEDLDSFNGTGVNGVRLAARQPQPLHDGDLVLFGNTEAYFSSPVLERATVVAKKITRSNVFRRVRINTQKNKQLEPPDKKA